MKVREFYDQIGQDYDAVLTRMMGSEDFAVLLLQTFRQDPTFGLLKETMQAGRPADIFDQAHTLKGLASNLGLKPLYEKTEALVELTRNGQRDGADELFAEVETVYLQMLALLQTVGSGEVV